MRKIGLIGKGNKLPQVSAYEDVDPPTIPVNLVVSNITNTTFQITNDDSGDFAVSPEGTATGVKGYRYYLKTGTVYTLLKEVLSSGRPTTITGRAPGSTFNVVATAYDYANNESGYSAVKSVTMTNTDTTDPVISSFVIETPAADSLIGTISQLTGTDDTTLSSNLEWWWQEDNTTLTSPTWTTKPSTITFSDYSAHTISIWCRDEAGNIYNNSGAGFDSNEVTPYQSGGGTSVAGLTFRNPIVSSTGLRFTNPIRSGPSITPVPVTNLSVTLIVSIPLCRIGWTLPENINGYTAIDIYRSSNGIDYSLLNSVAPNVTIYDDYSVSNGGTFYYYVKTRIGGTSSTASNIDSATVPTPSLSFPIPTGLSAIKTGSTTASVTYTQPIDVGDTLYYWIYARVVNGGDPTIFKTVSIGTNPTGALTATITGLSPSTTYYFFMVANDGTNYGAQSGNTNNITTDPAAGVIVNETFSDGSFNLGSVTSTGIKWVSLNSDGPASAPVISTTKAYSDTYSAKFAMGTGCTGSDQSLSEAKFGLGGQYDELWISFKLYIPADWTFGSSGQQKLFSISDDPSGGYGSLSGWVCELWPNASSTSAYLSFITNNLAPTGQEMQWSSPTQEVWNGWYDPPFQEFIGTADRDTWIDVKFYCKLATTTELHSSYYGVQNSECRGYGHDGEFKVWKNGVLYGQVAELPNNRTTTRGYYAGGYFWGARNCSAYPIDSTFYIDNIIISATDPDPEIYTTSDLILEDFSGIADGTQLNSYYDDYGTGAGFSYANGADTSTESVGDAKPEISSTLGEKTLKFIYGTGYNSWSEQDVTFGALYEEIWISFDIYFPAGCVFRYHPDHVGQKLFVIFNGGHTHDSAYQFNIVGLQAFSNNNGKGYLTITPHSNKKDTGSLILKDDGGIDNNGNCPNETYWREFYDQSVDSGRWMSWKFRHRVATNPTYAPLTCDCGPAFTGGGAGNNGIFQAWKDNVLIWDVQGIPNYCTTSGQNGYRDCYIMGWSNMGFATSTDIHIRNVQISTASTIANEGWETVSDGVEPHLAGLTYSSGFHWVQGATDAGGPGQPPVVSSDYGYGVSSKSLKFDYGSGLYDDQSISEQDFDLGGNYREIWIKWKEYYPVGTLFRYLSDFNGHTKFISIYYPTYTNTTLKLTFEYQCDSSNNGKAYLFWTHEWKASDGIFHGSAQISPSTISTVDVNHYCDNHGYFALYDPATDAGTWVEHKLRVKMATPGTVLTGYPLSCSAPNFYGYGNNGIIQYWKNGNLLVNITNAPLYVDIMPGFQYGKFAGASNNGFASPTSLYVDDFVFSDTSI